MVVLFNNKRHSIKLRVSLILSKVLFNKTVKILKNNLTLQEINQDSCFLHSLLLQMEQESNLKVDRLKNYSQLLDLQISRMGRRLILEALKLAEARDSGTTSPPRDRQRKQFWS
jgi:hypothetical protein